MTALEICLIIIGLITVGISYFIVDKAAEEHLKKQAENLVISEESRQALHVQTQEAVQAILENMSEDIAGRAERELEKLSNEKIMAVHDYSETVLDEINKNHNEVMFLYSILDEKDKEVKQTVAELQEMIRSMRSLENEIRAKAAAPVPTEAVPAVTMETQQGEELEDAELSEAEPVIEEPVMINKNELIMQLYKEGKTNLEIAKELGMGIGEVQLVVNLFKE